MIGNDQRSLLGAEVLLPRKPVQEVDPANEQPLAGPQNGVVFVETDHWSRSIVRFSAAGQQQALWVVDPSLSSVGR